MLDPKTLTAKSYLLMALKHVRDNDKIADKGICAMESMFAMRNLPMETGNQSLTWYRHDSKALVTEAGPLLAEMFKSWPKSDRKPGYPVPHPSRDRISAYLDAEQNGTMWTGVYGENRMELLNFCIRELEK